MERCGRAFLCALRGRAWTHSRSRFRCCAGGRGRCGHRHDCLIHDRLTGGAHLPCNRAWFTGRRPIHSLRSCTIHVSCGDDPCVKGVREHDTRPKGKHATGYTTTRARAPRCQCWWGCSLWAADVLPAPVLLAASCSVFALQPRHCRSFPSFTHPKEGHARVPHTHTVCSLLPRACIAAAHHPHKTLWSLLSHRPFPPHPLCRRSALHCSSDLATSTQFFETPQSAASSWCR